LRHQHVRLGTALGRSRRQTVESGAHAKQEDRRQEGCGKESGQAGSQGKAGVDEVNLLTLHPMVKTFFVPMGRMVKGALIHASWPRRPEDDA
jgi:hypothetical protein